MDPSFPTVVIPISCDENGVVGAQLYRYILHDAGVVSVELTTLEKSFQLLCT